MNLNSLFSPKTAPNSLKPTTFSPTSAVRFIDNEKSKRDWATHSTLSLLGLEEEYGSRVTWLGEVNKPVPDSDKRALESIKKELTHPSRSDSMEAAIAEFKLRNKIHKLYPEEGPYRRELYPKHMECYSKGIVSTERLLLGANRSGKTICGAYESVVHAVGIYPDWWPGYRFFEPIDGWIANKGAKEVRDINEQELLGPLGNLSLRGTGMIPGHRLIKCTPKSGTPSAIEFIYIRHVSGGISMLQSKSFDQGREAFQGTKKHWIWADEECPDDVYGEMIPRTMPTSDFIGGRVLLTYTPILGLTTLTTEFLRSAGIEIEGQPIAASEPKEQMS